VTGAWIRPLFDPALAKQPELRNRLLCLLACGLLDSGREYRNRINGLKKEAEKIGSKSVPFYLDYFEKYVALAVNIIEVFTRDEMITITELRNQWLHGHWTEIHKEHRVVYFARAGKIEKEKIPAAEYNEIFYRAGEPDFALGSLRERFCSYRTFFWAVDRVLARHDVQELMRADVALHAHFEAPDVKLAIPDPNFKPDQPNGFFLSLFELGDIILANEAKAREAQP
jgi:hypothetical protein